MSYNQSTIKKLGRQVSNYDDAVWSRLRGPMMRRGLRAKFQQNPDFMEKLLATGNMVLAECAPRDMIWGIGLAVDDIGIQDPLQWKGMNLLGSVLMEVRSDLRSWIATADEGIEYIDATDMVANEIWSMPFRAVSLLPRIREAIGIYREMLYKQTFAMVTTCSTNTKVPWKNWRSRCAATWGEDFLSPGSMK